MFLFLGFVNQFFKSWCPATLQINKRIDTSKNAGGFISIYPMNERLIKKQKQTDTSNESTSEQFVNLCITPLKFNSSPLKKGWLEDDPFLLGFSNFSGDSF